LAVIIVFLLTVSVGTFCAFCAGRLFGDGLITYDNQQRVKNDIIALKKNLEANRTALLSQEAIKKVALQ